MRLRHRVEENEALDTGLAVVDPDAQPRSSQYRIRSLTAANEHVCALYNDGTVACWSAGAGRALGRYIPPNTALKAMKIEGVKNAERLSVGFGSACALDANG